MVYGHTYRLISVRLGFKNITLILCSKLQVCYTYCFFNFTGENMYLKFF